MIGGYDWKGPEAYISGEARQQRALHKLRSFPWDQSDITVKSHGWHLISGVWVQGQPQDMGACQKASDQPNVRRFGVRL